jgi:hypothetical protein
MKLPFCLVLLNSDSSHSREYNCVISPRKCVPHVFLFKEASCISSLKHSLGVIFCERSSLSTPRPCLKYLRLHEPLARSHVPKQSKEGSMMNFPWYEKSSKHWFCHLDLRLDIFSPTSMRHFYCYGRWRLISAYIHLPMKIYAFGFISNGIGICFLVIRFVVLWSLAGQWFFPLLVLLW